MTRIFFQQYRHGKGLGHIVVDVHTETPELRFFPVQGGEHQNRNLGLLADQLANSKTIDFREHQVQQNQVESLSAKQCQGCHAIPSYGGLITGVLQVGTQQLLDVRLVFNNQNAFH